MNDAPHSHLHFSKAHSFVAVDFESSPGAEQVIGLHAFTIADNLQPANPVLEGHIAALVQHWKGLTNQIREEIKIFARQHTPAQDASDEADLIDAFLTQVPRLSRKFRLQGPQSQADAPQTVYDSIEDDEELVTETLATLHLKQGNKAKAKQIYQRLMLIYPEKCSYFADLIEQIS